MERIELEPDEYGCERFKVGNTVTCRHRGDCPFAQENKGKEPPKKAAKK